MNAKQWIITAVAVTLTAFAYTAAAECEDEGGNFVKTGYLLQASNDRHEGRDQNSSRGNENSNRQSDDDSTRGQERAEERRGEKDHDKHSAKNDPRWYNPFGWKYPFDWFD